MKQVPAWTRPGSAYVVEQLVCGQSISIAELDKGHFKIVLGSRFAYVDAKYVSLSQGQQQRAPQLPQAAQPSRPIHRQQPPEQTPQTETPQPDDKQPPSVTPVSATISEERSSKTSDRQQEGRKRHEGGLYFDISHVYYGEPDFMRNKGYMWGVSGDYTYRPDKFMLRAEGRFSFGNVDYWSMTSGTADDLRDHNFETRFTFGYDIGTSNMAIVTPFVGLGHRYLLNSLSEYGPGGYDRKSNYLYSPIGMETMFHLGSGWSLGIIGEYDLFWHGWQYSELGDHLVPTLPPIILQNFVAKNDQENGWGARGSVKVIKRIGIMDFAFEPFFRYWNIGDSDLIELLQYPYSSYEYYWMKEPQNSTMEWGTRIGIRF